MMYGYYELTGAISEEKFNSYEEIEAWAIARYGYYDPDYLFDIPAEEIDDYE